MNTAAQIFQSKSDPVDTSTSTKSKTAANEKMEALAWFGTEDIRLVKVEKPLITDPTDAIVRVTKSTICGSDLHLYTNEIKDMRPYDIVGHEACGVVESIGKQVKNVKEGQRVVISFAVSCGECSYCKRGETSGCDTTNPSRLMEKMYGHRTAGILGYSHLLGGYSGCQAQFVRVPFADVDLLPIPDQVSDDKALFLSDVLCTSYHATELCSVKEGDVVAIWGLGPIGLLAAKWCQIKKAKRVIGIDGVDYRLQMGLNELGIEIIDFTKDNVCELLGKMVPGGVDCAIDAAGFRYTTSTTHKIERALNLETDSCDVLTECITGLRKYGRLSIIADYAGYTNHFPIGAFMEKHLSCAGGQCPVQAVWHKCLEYILSGDMDPTFIVTHTGTLKDGPELYSKFHKKEDGIIKVILST
eukprot:NODE_54_length_26799_cov_0.554794.p4 type:complete len:414 gc:universal NODE_54_length_26799_cov_0.554794:13845-15086(+)